MAFLNFMIKVPKFIPFLFKSQIWQFPNSDKYIYLTFDDGPIPEVTESILSILEEKQVEATFFCIGDNIKKYPDLFKK
jgi:peptidoglycan/xylan/chitin deacetylase (PgdA/CDA1 family)